MRNSRGRKKVLFRRNSDYALAIQHLKDMGVTCPICGFLTRIIKNMVSKNPRKMAYGGAILSGLDGGEWSKQPPSCTYHTGHSGECTCL